MKKRLLILLIIPSFFLLSIKVNAYGLGSTLSKTKYDADDYRLRSDRTLYVRKYRASGTSNPIYCADVSMQGYTNLKVNKVLNADRCRTGSSDQSGCRAGAHDDYWEGLYDAALLFALNGTYYDDGNQTYSRSYSYQQRLIAIRALDSLNPKFRQGKYSTAFTANIDVHKYIVNSAVAWTTELPANYVSWVFGRYDKANDQWLDTDAGSAGKITRNEIINHLWGGSSHYKVCNQHGNDCKKIGTDQLDTKYDTVKGAKEIFQSAIRYAGKYKEGRVPGQAPTPKVSANSTIKSLTPEVQDLGIYNGQTYSEYTRQLTLEVTFKDFSKSNDGPVYIKVNPDVSGRVYVDGGLMYYKDISQKDATWTPFTSSTDFSGLLKGKDTVTYQILIPLRATDIQKADKYKIDFQISFEYKELSVGQGFRLVPNTGSSSGLQYFYMGVATGSDSPVPHPIYLSFTWEPYDEVYCKYTDPTPNNIDEYKLYLKRCCRPRENGNSRDIVVEKQCKNAKTDAAKKFWCETKQAYCDYCNDKITIPYMCAEFSDDKTTVPDCIDGADASIMSPSDIKICVLDYSDIVDNSYQLTRDNASNETKNGEVENDTKSYHDYCNIFCKEDYKIGLPLGKWVNAGSSFTLDLQVDGTKSCYTDEINYALFKKDYDKAYNNLKANRNTTNITNYNKVVGNYNACATLYSNNKDTQSTLLNIKSGDQTINFKYEEDYLKNASGIDQKVPLNKQSETTDNLVLWFCDGDVDNEYNKCLGGNPWSIKTESLPGFDCSGGICKETTITIPRTRYAKSISSNHALYTPSTEFFTTYTGNKYTKSQLNALFMQVEKSYADTDPVERLNKINADYAKVGYKKITKTVYINQTILKQDSYPIKMSSETGAYNFDIIFSGFGEYFNTGKTGRLIGNTNSVAVRYSSDFKGEYFCEYTVNCENCRVTAKPTPGKTVPPYTTPPIINPPTVTYEPYQEIITNLCRGCGVRTPGNDSEELIFRQISLTDVNPSDRGLGYNLINLKGAAALKEIETTGEEIYNDKNVKISKYEITLTPEVINYINDYLKKNKGDVVSGTGDLKCDSYYRITSNEPTSMKHKVAERFDYLICESNLLDNLAKNKKANVKDNLKTKSWVESEYCLGNECIIGSGFGYGQVFGPAYK